MRVSLKKFTTDPYKYARKAPVIILLGDDPAYALIPYTAYKSHFLQSETKEAGTTAPAIQILPSPTKQKNWLLRLLFD